MSTQNYQGPVIVDLPRNLFVEAEMEKEGIRHFFPSRTLDEEEASRRHGQAPGVLILESESRGIQIAKVILESLEDPKDIANIAETLPALGIGSTWYQKLTRQKRNLSRQSIATQRSNMVMERMERENAEDRPSAYMLRQSAIADLLAATNLSKEIVTAARGRENILERQWDLSNILGHASLTIACIPFGDEIGYSNISNKRVQALGRERSLHALERVHILASVTHEIPSMAGLDKRDNAAARQLRLEATSKRVLEAYDKAEETIPSLAA